MTLREFMSGRPVLRIAEGSFLDRRESQTFRNEENTIEIVNVWVNGPFGGFPHGKNLPANAGDIGSIPGSGRSPGEENCDPLQYSCLGNPMDKGNW